MHVTSVHIYIIISFCTLSTVSTLNPTTSQYNLFHLTKSTLNSNVQHEWINTDIIMYALQVDSIMLQKERVCLTE